MKLQSLAILLLLIVVAGCSDQTGAVTRVTINDSSISSNAYQTTFSNSDLNANNILNITHGLDTNNIGVHVYNNNVLLISADNVKIVDKNSLWIDLTSFRPLTGTWKIVVFGATNLDFAGTFDSSDVYGGSVTLQHNLNTEDIGVFVYDESGFEIDPDEVEPLSANRVNINVHSFNLSGTYHAVIFQGVTA